MKSPTTPIDEATRAWMEYSDWLKTRAGFMETYANTLASIWHSSRVKSKLRATAYEATEVHYQYVTGKERRYPDIENFRKAWHLHVKNLLGKFKKCRTKCDV